MAETTKELSIVIRAKNAANAQYYLASAGMNTKQVIASLSGVMLLAGATQSDLAFSADTVASTLSQFGLKAEESGRVANVFAAAISASQANMDKLAYSMRYVGPVAKGLGISLEETTGALSLLYNAGFQGEQAETILRGALARLIKPTDDASGALMELGVEVNDSTGKFRPLVDIVRDLEKGHMSAEQALRIFGQEAGPGMMAFVAQGSAALAGMTAKITGTQKATEMYGIQMDTFKGSFESLKGSIETFAINIGNKLIPPIREAVDFLMQLTNSFNALPQGVQDTVLVMGLAATAFAAVGGPILLLAAALPSIVSGFGLLATASAALTPVFLPVAAAVAAFITGWQAGKALGEITVGGKPIKKYIYEAFEFWLDGGLAARPVSISRKLSFRVIWEYKIVINCCHAVKLLTYRSP